jgi:hypothetical protein
MSEITNTPDELDKIVEQLINFGKNSYDYIGDERPEMGRLSAKQALLQWREAYGKEAEEDGYMMACQATAKERAQYLAKIIKKNSDGQLEKVESLRSQLSSAESEGVK